MIDNKKPSIINGVQINRSHIYGWIGGLVCLVVAILFSTCEKIPDHCGKYEKYDPKFQFCFGGYAHKLCSDGEYNPLTEGCDGKNLVGTRCADSTFVTPGTPCGGYTLNTASAPATGGSIQRSANGPNYAAWDRVTLVAEAAEGYTFAGWAGASTDANPAVTITMDSNKPLVAMFKPNTPTLATTPFPPTGGDITRTANGDGTQVTVTATPATGHTFTNWEGASTSTQPTVTVTVDEGKTLVAMFKPDKYTLTASANPATGGTVFINNTASTGKTTQHDAGAQVKVLARAAEGYTFTGWSGALTSADSSATIAMDNNKTLTANFRQAAVTPPTTYTLSTSVSPTGAGSVTLNPPGGSYAAGTEVTATASPAGGYEFVNWSGVSSSVNSSVTITMPAGNATLTANFQSIGGGGELVPGWQFNREIDYGLFTDTRDGKSQTYRTVKIGNQTWMAENLNYSGPNGSTGVCYGGSPDICAKYGRLYDWAEVMGFTLSCNSSNCESQVQNLHRGICPAGWHVPNDAEWVALTEAVGGGSTAGTKLKSKGGWKSGGNGTDNYGFSGLPGGYGNSGDFYYAGDFGSWWSATENGAVIAWNLYMFYNYEYVNLYNDIFKASQSALRCVQDK